MMTRITDNVDRILGVVLQSLSVNFSMFVASRFFLGFGISISHGSSPLLITELVHPQHRAIFTTIYNTTWYVGSIIAAWTTYGTFKIPSNWSWRIPTVIMCAPSITQVLCVWFVPESPRFLIARGQSDKALATLGKVHGNGNVNDEVVQLEFQEVQETLRMEKEIEGNGWTELIKTKGNRHRLIILISAGCFSKTEEN
jgi:MFS family permease